MPLYLWQASYSPEGTKEAVNAAGAVRLHSTPLPTSEELDAATKKTVAYRPPGA
jgi:hypothetical protein